MVFRPRHSEEPWDAEIAEGFPGRQEQQIGAMNRRRDGLRGKGVRLGSYVGARGLIDQHVRDGGGRQRGGGAAGVLADAEARVKVADQVDATRRGRGGLRRRRAGRRIQEQAAHVLAGEGFAQRRVFIDAVLQLPAQIARAVLGGLDIFNAAEDQAASAICPRSARAAETCCWSTSRRDRLEEDVPGICARAPGLAREPAQAQADPPRRGIAGFVAHRAFTFTTRLSRRSKPQERAWACRLRRPPPRRA